MDAHRLAGGGAGGPDPGQDWPQDRIVRAGFAAERIGQVPGPDVQAVHTVHRQRRIQIADRLRRLGHDDAEWIVRGEHAARRPVPGGRVAAGASRLPGLSGRVNVRHDHARTAEIQSPADIGRVRMTNPADRSRARQPYRGGQTGQVMFGRRAVLQVDHHVVQPRSR
jgi:hypothetical protein